MTGDHNSAELKIGTRGSPLAMAQANQVRSRLLAVHEDLSVDLVVIKTTGDAVQDRRLSEIGGKGLFTKEIQEALLDGRIDLAVHSMKDVETWLPAETMIVAMLPREDPRDVFISNTAPGLDDLPAGAVVGTSSLRRQAQILYRRPDLRVEALRGNVQTRLRRIQDRRFDATLLALAGLRRLGLENVATTLIDPAVILPAVAQGAIGLEVRRDNERARQIAAPLDHAPTSLCVGSERAMLAALDGSCHTPIAGLALLDENASRVTLTGLVAQPDGSVLYRIDRTGQASEAANLGADLGAELRSRMPPDFFA